MLLAARPRSPSLSWRSLSQSSLTVDGACGPEIATTHIPRSPEVPRRATRRSPGVQHRNYARTDVMSRSDERDEYVTSSLDETGSGERASHDRRRAYSMSRFVRIKDEVNRKLKTTRAFQQRIPPRLVSMGDGRTRKVYVVIGTSAQLEPCIEYPEGNGISQLGGLDRNISDWLKLESVEHGMFSASFPLTRIPAGDLTILVFDLKIQLTVKVGVTQRVKGGPKYHVLHLGFMKLPMYLDNDTLEFEISDTGDLAMVVTAKLKGCNNNALTHPPSPKNGTGSVVTGTVSFGGASIGSTSRRGCDSRPGALPGLFPGRRHERLSQSDRFSGFRSRSHTQ